MQGLEFSEKNLALDLIAETRPGGYYMDSMHTIEHMREVALSPTVATRETLRSMGNVRRADAGTLAMKEARKILRRENPAVFSKEVDEKICLRFKGLVAGNAWLEE